MVNPRCSPRTRRQWGNVWKSGVSVSGAPSLQRAINANTYDLYASIRNDSPDAIGPSGLSSDGYAGMVFWDSGIWMFRAILATHPDIARAAVDYRFNTLAAAKHDASANGYLGAFYPWTAGDDGLTGADCYGTTTDANDKIISDPNFSCSEELHLQADIAIAQWQYYGATGDIGWLRAHGWPVLEALAQFWVSKAAPDPSGGYDINTVQPPDEYHTGVNNSAYTNAAAATALQDAVTGPTLPVKTPSGPVTVAAGQGLTIPTRRPDLQKTNDLARCQTVSASSFVPGDEPVAAIDGSTATPWVAVATDPRPTLTVQLAKRTSISTATVTRGSTGSFSYNVETSTDGRNWRSSPQPQRPQPRPTNSSLGRRRPSVRLYFPGGSGASAPNIDELSVGGG